VILAVHEHIVREALGETLSPRALRLVIRANKRSDLHQLAPEYHFDSAPDSRALCELQRRGLDAWLTRAVARAAPPGREAGPLERRRALADFGRATHALADFYAHTNWIELALARGESPLPAPLLAGSSALAQLPAGLQSGYFHLRHGLTGCPRGGPPAGFAFCHAQLNKDSPRRGHGAEQPGRADLTYHDIAVQLAIASTRSAWDALCSGIRAAQGEAALAERSIAQLARG
jgi:hypothetical protein